MSEGEGGGGRLGYLNTKCELCFQVYNPRLGRLVDTPVLGRDGKRKAHINCFRFLVTQAALHNKSYEELLDRACETQCASCKQTKASVVCVGELCSDAFHIGCVAAAGGEVDYLGATVLCPIHADKNDNQTLGLCLVCGWRTSSSDGTVLACCNKVVHISCAQVSLVSCAQVSSNQHSVSCPACHNQQEFEASLQQRGVYINNAHDELLFLKEYTQTTPSLSSLRAIVSPAARRHTVGGIPSSAVANTRVTKTPLVTGKETKKNSAVLKASNQSKAVAATVLDYPSRIVQQAAGTSPAGGTGVKSPSQRRRQRSAGFIPEHARSSRCPSPICVDLELLEEQPQPRKELDSQEGAPESTQLAKNQVRKSGRQRKNSVFSALIRAELEEEDQLHSNESFSCTRSHKSMHLPSSKVGNRQQLIRSSNTGDCLPRNKASYRLTTIPANQPHSKATHRPNSSDQDSLSKDQPVVSTLDCSCPSILELVDLTGDDEPAIPLNSASKNHKGQVAQPAHKEHPGAEEELSRPVQDLEEEEELSRPTHNDSGYSTKSSSVSPANLDQIVQMKQERDLGQPRPIQKSRNSRTRSVVGGGLEGCVCGICFDCAVPSLSVQPKPPNPLILNTISPDKNKDIESRSCPENSVFVAITDCPEGSENPNRKSLKRRRGSDEENIVPKRSRNALSSVKTSQPFSGVDKMIECEDSSKPRTSLRKKGAFLSLLQGLPSTVINAIQRNMRGREPAQPNQKQTTPKKIETHDIVDDESSVVVLDDVTLNRVECLDELHVEADMSAHKLKECVKLTSSPRDQIHPEDGATNCVEVKQKPPRHRKSLKEVFITNPRARKPSSDASNLQKKSTTFESKPEAQSKPTKKRIDKSKGNARRRLISSDTNRPSSVKTSTESSKSEDITSDGDMSSTSSANVPNLPAAAGKRALDTPTLPTSKRRKVGKTIQELSNRRIIHGRNWVPWKQDTEQYMETQYNSIPELLERNVSDFVDVNPGEKGLVKLWNEFFKDKIFVGRVQLCEVILGFIEENAHIIIHQKLYNNFLLHLGNLEQTGAIDSSSLLKLVVHMQTKLVGDNHADKLLSDSLPRALSDAGN